MVCPSSFDVFLNVVQSPPPVMKRKVLMDLVANTVQVSRSRKERRGRKCSCSQCDQLTEGSNGINGAVLYRKFQ
jgi:hypothetical protein